MRLDDPELVRAEYEDEARLAVRQAAHASGEGPDALALLLEAVGEPRPNRVLDIGCGQGEIAQRIETEHGADVVAVDQSPRMVELTRQRGIDARLGDVQALDFDEESFDCVVAAWMLFHVRDLDRGLSEIARVLRRGGRLVAATNGRDHLQELYDMLGTTPLHSAFNAENGERLLLGHFAHVEPREAKGYLVFASSEAAQAYVDAALSISGTMPPIEGPIRVRRTPVIFVAEKA